MLAMLNHDELVFVRFVQIIQILSSHFDNLFHHNSPRLPCLIMVQTSHTAIQLRFVVYF